MNRFESMSIDEQESSEQQDPTPVADAAIPPEEIAVVHHEETAEVPADAEQAREHQHRETKHKQLFDAFISELDSLPDAEKKLERTIQFMESTLAHGGTPHFKSFWDARNLCLEFFKQNIAPVLRSQLWTKYTELSKEARRLKEILEEQSAFAAEQIEIAIKALEDDIKINSDILHAQPALTFGITCKTLEKKMSRYDAIQKELNLLNVQASRINALRKELIKTEMRIKHKNKFFQRLSAAGDLVFPRRKELIKEVSQHFMEDVDAFILENFSTSEFNDSLFFLREEIKALQGMAKVLTLNTHSFTHTRLRLSECWDKIKGCEKERKKARAHQKSLFKQNVEAVLQKIQEFSQAYAEGPLSNADASKKLDEITNFMRQVELGRDELKFLRDELTQARKPLMDKLKQEEQDRLNQEQERDRQRKQRLQDLWDEVEALLKNADAYDAEKLFAEREAILLKLAQAPLSKLEKQELERQLKPLRDTIAEKKERALLDLSADDLQKLQQLKELLKEKKELRQEIKNQVEIYRKAQGNSGFDFEQAMTYNTQMAQEKERLEKINQGIREIEAMIHEVEKRS